ncbi:MAG TPA: hypothetical protein VKX45_17275 [Bryobacteraceae bacterium]|jgi:hypothetical protein|nr:hypothetical protein [Bryobacteraceae bacterium]
MSASKQRSLSIALIRLPLWFCACNLLAAALSAQCPSPVTAVPAGTYTSGDYSQVDPNALSASNLSISGGATATFVAGNCIDLKSNPQGGVGFHANAIGATVPTTFHAWVDMAPTAVSFSPSSPPANPPLSQSFTWTVASPAGHSNLSHVFALFNTTSASTANACYIHYDASSNLVYLADNAGATWLGGFAPSSAASAANSQCTIAGTGSSSNPSSAGTQLALTLTVTFHTTFAGTKNEYLYALDSSGTTTGWQPMGTWAVPGPPPPQQYYLVTAANPSNGGSVSPSCPSGCSYPSGSSVQITATAANGYQFTGWTGVDSSNGATAYVTVSNNRTVTANFTTLSTTTQTISTSRPGLSFSVDGTTYTTAQTFTWPSGTSHTLAAPGAQQDSSGAQYFFSAWSDAGDLTHPITATSSIASYTAQYATTTIASLGGYSVPNDGSQSSYWTYCVSTSQTQCIDGGFDAAGISSCSILGGGVTVTGMIAKPNGVKYEFELQFTADRTAWHGAHTLTCTYNGQKLSLANALMVYDATPVITSIAQDAPMVNGSFYVTLTGKYFGTAPGTVVPCAHTTASPAPPCGSTPTSDLTITQPSPYWQSQPASAPLDSWNNTQVKALVTPSASASGTYDLVINSTGVSTYGGTAFLARNGTQPESNREPITIVVPTMTFLPTQASIGVQGYMLTIQGTNLLGSGPPSLDFGSSGITYTIQSYDNSQVTGFFSVPATAQPGRYTVTLTPGGTTVRATATLTLVPGPGTLTGQYPQTQQAVPDSAGIWWLGTGAPDANDGCDPNRQIFANGDAACYWTWVTVTLTPGAGASPPSAGSPVTWSFTDAATNQPAQLVAWNCQDAPACSRITVKPNGAFVGTVSVQATLGGIASATFQVGFDYPGYVVVTRTVDRIWADPGYPAYQSDNYLQLFSAGGRPMFYMPVHEEFPSPDSWSSCGKSVGWTDPIPQTAPDPTKAWGSWVTLDDGTLGNVAGPAPDTVGYGCPGAAGNCSPSSDIPGSQKVPAQGLSQQANAWSDQYIVVGSQTTNPLGRYIKVQADRQVRYTDHGRDELGTWICPQ